MKPTSLSTQLSHTSQMLERVCSGQSLDRCLETVPADIRAGVKALSYHAMRHLGTTRAVADLLLQKQPPLLVCALLWTALSLLLVDDAPSEDANDQDSAHYEHPSYKPYVLVSQAVDAAKGGVKTKPFAALVNGVLRRFMREKKQLLAQAQKNNVCAQWNFQPWWVERLQQDWPQQWQEILQYAQFPAPMVLRVNAQWATVERGCEYLNKQGLEARVVGPYALELEKPVNVAQIEGFERGYFSVQSAAAQLAAPLLLDPAWFSDVLAQQGRPLRVLDACCAPGGKTAHLLEIAPADSIEVLAVDSDKGRLVKVEETLDRIGLQAQLRHADLTSPEAFGKDEMFDAILLDAPCSASGIVRRHPDIRWLRRAEDIGQLGLLQQKIADTLWEKLKPGGRLLYSTCSLFKAEGAEQVQNFKLRHNQLKQLKAPGHLLPLNIKDGVVDHDGGSMNPVAADGFYYALFEK